MSNSLRKAEQVFLRTVRTHGMLQPGDRVLIALSGGADSVTMFRLFCLLRRELGITVAAAHLHHGLRAAADGDEAFVRELCASCETELFVKRLDVAEIAAREGKSVEEAGRDARYSFFREIRAAHGFQKIATAHNRNDNAETVLLHILRGTGTDGLCGIPYARGDGVIRPLLDLTRAEIEAACAENGWQYRTDESNMDTAYTRNRVRRELIPFLQEKFNPGIVEGLTNLAANLTEDAEFLDGYARRLYRRLNSPMPNRGPEMLHIESLRLIQPSIQSRLVRIAAEEAAPDCGILERRHVAAVLGLLDKQTGTGVDLPGGLRAEVRYGWLAFLNRAAENEHFAENSEKNEFCLAVEPENSYNIIRIGKKFSLSVIDPKQVRKPKGALWLDYAGLEETELCLRNRRRGDKIAVFADGRRKSVKSLLIDRKIPREEREGFPLLCGGGEVLAVPGLRVSETRRVTETTRRALVITSEEIGSQ